MGLALLLLDLLLVASFLGWEAACGANAFGWTLLDCLRSATTLFVYTTS